MNKAKEYEDLTFSQGVDGDIHSGLTEDQVMFRTLIAMCIPALAAIFAMGTNALYNILTAVVTSLLCHYLLKAIDLRSIKKLRKTTYETPYSPLVAGMIVGLCMGELSPYYITAIVAVLTMVGFKWGQEKYFQRKIINPAAGAKALVLLIITISWFLPDSLVSGMLFYPEHLMFNLFTEEGFLGAMELAEQMNFYGTENLSITQSLIFWKAHGWIGGASGILTLASGILLALWIKLKWRISLSYLGGMAVLAVFLGAATGGHIAMRIAFHVFTGSVVFLGFYMATEPQTTPVTHSGQYLFGISLAFLTLGLQLLGLFGSSFIALAILNPYSAYLDKVRIKKPFGKEQRRYSPAESLPTAPDTTSPVLTYDPSKCITCSRCIKACEEIQGNGILGYGDRGRNIFTTAGLGERGTSDCRGCGECLEYCPTGALKEKYPIKPLRKWDTETVITTCTYCGIGCQLELYTRDGKIAKVRGVDEAPNYGSLCIKGRFGHTYVDQKDRLTQPLLRRGGNLEAVTWEEALNEIADRFDEFSSEEIAGLASSQNTNEESYLFQKFMRAVLHTNNIDYFSRLCFAPLETGMDKVFGWRSATNSIEDIKDNDCILVAGAEVSESHPIISNYIKQAVNQKNAQLIVISSRKTKLTNWADIWLKPEDNTETYWINGLINIIIENNLQDKEFINKYTEKFSELKESIKEYSPERVSKVTGIDPEEINETAEIFARAINSAIVCDMGISQFGNGIENMIALSNLSLITGNIGKDAGGIYPLKDQNNDQGTGDMGVNPYYLPGYQELDNAETRKKYESIWQTDLFLEKGLNAVEIIEKASRREIKAMLIMGDSEVFVRPIMGEIKRGLEELDFLVAITPFLNDTAEMADIILPAATFAEKNGTFTNLERRILRVRKAFNPPEEARADWEILSALASRMGYKQMNYEDPEEIMNEISELIPFYGKVNHWKLDNNHYEHQSGISEISLEEKIRLYPALKLSDIENKVKINNLKSGDNTFVLTTGRILFHFRTGFMNPQVEALNSFIEEPYVEIYKEDAEKLELENEEKVKISTAYGEIEAESRITDRLNKGTVFVPFQFLPFHFAERTYNSSGEKDNHIMSYPEYRVSTCIIEKMYSR